MTFMLYRPLTLSSLFIVPCLLISSAQSVSASALDDPQGKYRYQLRAFGALAGEALLSIDPPTALSEGVVRKVRIEARTAGAAARIFKAEGEGTAVLNQHFLPLRMKWKATIRDRLRQAEASMDAQGMRGTYQYGSKPPRMIDQSCDRWPLDAVSAYLWLPHQLLDLGAEYRLPFFDGKRMGHLWAKVGKPRSIQVPIGLREVVPMKIRAGRKGKERRVTFWVGKDDRVLYRIDVSHGILGTVRAELVGIRRPKQGSGSAQGGS